MAKIIYAPQQKYLNSFKKESDPLILEIENFAKKNNVPILNWLAAEFLEQIILIHKPKLVLELGTAVAYSSIRIAKNLRKKGLLDSIEKSKENVNVAKGFIKKAKLEEKINVIEGDALEIMPNLNKKYDFIFLDADKEDYQKLFYYSLMLMKKGGILFVDNLLWQGYAASSKVPADYRTSTRHIREFNKLFTTQFSLKTTILSIGDGIGIGIKVK